MIQEKHKKYIDLNDLDEENKEAKKRLIGI